MFRLHFDETQRNLLNTTDPERSKSVNILNLKPQVSSDQNPGCMLFIGDYTIWPV